jgi:hypothetical protein
MNTVAIPSATEAFGAGLSLPDFTNLGWEQHVAEPAAVLAALRQRAAGLPADAEGAAAIGLAEHVCLSHLHSPSELAAWIATLPAELSGHADTTAALAKARWALGGAEGHAVSGLLADGPRWRALQNVWACRVGQGRADDAAAELAVELPAALAHPEAAARRALAATCNNLAVELREGPRGEATRDRLMLAAASASHQLWSGAGGWVQIERADYQLARCHAALGDGASARRHGQAVLDALTEHRNAPEADDFEWFFGHEAMAWAHRSAGDPQGASAQRVSMQTRMAQVDDAELRGWCEQALRDYDRAG